MSSQVNPQVDPQVEQQVNPPEKSYVESYAESYRDTPSAQSPQSAPSAPGPRARYVPDSKLIVGVMLIAFGLLALVGTLTNSAIMGMSILPALGILFIIWGLLARQPGLMIPGGILTGLGVGILISDLAFGSAVGEIRGGIIVLGLGIGFLMIIPLIWLISPERHWWALIPGGILAIIGIALIIGGGALSVLASLGQLWPIVPIVVGVLLIWQLFRQRADTR